MKIVVLDGYALDRREIDWSVIDSFGEMDYHIRQEEDSPACTIRSIGDAEIVLTNKTIINREVIEACPNIKYIGVMATGYNVVDIKAAAERGIPVTNIPAYSTDSVVQHVFALLLEICMQTGLHNEAVHRKEWSKTRAFCFWHTSLIELANKTLGLIGFGNIGSKVAVVARALGMKVLVDAAHPGKLGKEQAEAGLIELVDRDQLLAKSDVLSFHCPLTEETTNLLRKENIDKMKDGAIVINTARGPIINEPDLVEALNSGKIYAAGLDVVSYEPMQDDNPLFEAKNCIITPHIAWAPLESRQRLMETAENNIRAFLEGNPINVVNM